jgi:hypothetical protein
MSEPKNLREPTQASEPNFLRENVSELTQTEPVAHGSDCHRERRHKEKDKMIDARKYLKGATFLTVKDVEQGPILAVIDKVEEGKYGKLNLVFEDMTAYSYQRHQ